MKIWSLLYYNYIHLFKITICDLNFSHLDISVDISFHHLIFTSILLTRHTEGIKNLKIHVDNTSGKLSADITATKDPMLKRSTDNFEKHVKNIYRTLLTRGMKGVLSGH